MIQRYYLRNYWRHNLKTNPHFRSLIRVLYFTPLIFVHTHYFFELGVYNLRCTRILDLDLKWNRILNIQHITINLKTLYNKNILKLMSLILKNLEENVYMAPRTSWNRINKK